MGGRKEWFAGVCSSFCGSPLWLRDNCVGRGPALQGPPHPWLPEEWLAHILPFLCSSLRNSASRPVNSLSLSACSACSASFRSLCYGEFLWLLLVLLLLLVRAAGCACVRLACPVVEQAASC